MTTLELIEYYINLLIIQYATQPNAIATISAFIGELIQNQIVAAVGAGFNFTVTPVGQPPDGAAGVQLDAVASYRGVNRVVYGLAPLTFFQYADAIVGAPFDANGFMDPTDPDSPSDITWYFLTSEQTDVPLYSLTDDEEYRLTQFRAKAQSMFMSLENIDNLMETFFGNNAAMIDNENMTMYYVDLTSDTDTLFGICAITNSFPVLQGCS